MKTASALVAGLVLTVAFSGLALAGLKGSKHDFSDDKWADGDSCMPCHQPHREKDPEVAPLWNRNADLTRRFARKNKRADKPGPGTTTCLSCHDGTIAKNTTGAIKVGREPLLHKQHPRLLATGHGRSDHPVGREYPQFKKDYHPQHRVVSRGLILPNGKVECTSCHDPHNDKDLDHMLLISNQRSNLCLTCHNK